MMGRGSSHLPIATKYPHFLFSRLSPSRSLFPPTHPDSPVIVSPCAACKFLRQRCAEKCVLAPYFPSTDPAKFAIAHRVFSASNTIKFLQTQVSELQAQLAKVQAEMVNMRCRQEDLMAMLCMEMAAKISQPQIFQHLAHDPLNSPDCIHRDIPSFQDIVSFKN
ncbi:hypothetical protein SAY87_001097 [Trapa incisa]|uniref:LOB domain-containing protein n=1 Tax=Trapa incisa TaxID=236973 RepID=A0AAN7GD29_9MYRT|nr:hypothetical protein SAY87_001097 [Trapa incisa]